MNTYTIESFFENYKELIPSVIEKGRILRLGYNEENGTFTCQAAFDKLVPFDSTVEFEMKMRAALGAGKFILQLKYTPDMLCAEYFPELCKFLKSRFPLVNGFFDNAEAVYENGIFTVNIKHGGEALLKKAGIETAFPALTMELFSVRADIKLTGVLETDMEAHQREQEEFLNSLPVPKKTLHSLRKRRLLPLILQAVLLWISELQMWTSQGSRFCAMTLLCLWVRQYPETSR